MHRNIALFVPHEGCPHACVFCNQKTISGQTQPLTAETVRRSCEIALQKEYPSEDSEIAFFGGSFTAIEPDRMRMYLETVQPYLGENGFSGIRISTRPDCITPEILRVLRAYRVTDVELGAQSMSERVLQLNRRGHSPEDTVRAVGLLKEYGFGTGLQMMTGLYGSTPRDDMETAERFIALRPDTVRIYPTVVLENTELARLWRAGEYTAQTVEEAVPLCATLLRLFRENGIRVIRVGLHSGGHVEDGFLAGAYHPAFGELCESEIFFREAAARLRGRPHGDYIIYVRPTDFSKMIGQKRSNILRLQTLGYRCRVMASENTDPSQYHAERKNHVSEISGNARIQIFPG